MIGVLKYINYKSNQVMKKTGSEVYIQKTILIENQETGQSNSFRQKLSYNPTKRQVNISQVLRDLHSNGVPLHNTQIFYMDFEKRMYVFLGTFPSKDEIILGYEYMIDDLLTIRYKKIGQEVQEATPLLKSKKKVKQRTIKQVCSNVKEWRRLYNLEDATGKRIHTLQSAAQVVGMAKKTLDDYHSHLRFAENYNFNFEKHMDDKIGLLRGFVKMHRKNIKKEEEQTSKANNSIDQFWVHSDSDQDKDLSL